MKTTWYANRNFIGLDTDGKTSLNFKRGDAVKGVERWPTFRSLVNTSYIVDYKVGVKDKVKREVTKG